MRKCVIFILTGLALARGASFRESTLLKLSQFDFQIPYTRKLLSSINPYTIAGSFSINQLQSQTPFSYNISFHFKITQKFDIPFQLSIHVGDHQCHYKDIHKVLTSSCRKTLFDNFAEYIKSFDLRIEINPPSINNEIDITGADYKSKLDLLNNKNNLNPADLFIQIQDQIIKAHSKVLEKTSFSMHF